jgi:hypothetical protein
MRSNYVENTLAEMLEYCEQEGVDFANALRGARFRVDTRRLRSRLPTNTFVDTDPPVEYVYGEPDPSLHVDPTDDGLVCGMVRDGDERWPGAGVSPRRAEGREGTGESLTTVPVPCACPGCGYVWTARCVVRLVSAMADEPDTTSKGEK